jgi:hypothetical protein
MKRACLAGSYLLLWTVDAWAYLDPGTGSILIQGLIAAMATGLFAFRSKLVQIKAMFAPKGDVGDVNSDKN